MLRRMLGGLGSSRPWQSSVHYWSDELCRVLRDTPTARLAMRTLHLYTTKHAEVSARARVCVCVCVCVLSVCPCVCVCVCRAHSSLSRVLHHDGLQMPLEHTTRALVPDEGN